MTVEEEERLLRGCRGYLNGQLVDIVTFALHTGMRQGEILNLKWSDTDLTRKVVTVIKTKNKSPKTIPITDTVHSLLLRKKQEQGKVVSITGYVFTTSTGTRILASNLQREFYNAMKKAGIENFRFHDLRHTAGTKMIQNGVDIYTVAKILGHKSISTTMRYAHHCPESLRDAVKVLDTFSSKKGLKMEAVS